MQSFAHSGIVFQFLTDSITCQINQLEGKDEWFYKIGGGGNIGQYHEVIVAK